MSFKLPSTIISSSVKPLLSYTIHPHKTVFGGVRDDVIVVDINETEGLSQPCKLIDFVQVTLPNVTLDALQEMIYFQSIFISYFRLPTDMLSNLDGTKSHRRQRARKQEREAQGITRKTTGFGTPLLTRRNEVLPIYECELPKATKSVRFHLKPLRFFVASLIDWTDRILWENDFFIVVDKPAGLPCEPVASNNIECLHTQIGRHLGFKLEPLHRIDLWTSGAVCLAKTKEAVQLFNRWQRERKIRKFYRLLCSRLSINAIPLSHVLGFSNNQSKGRITHWMSPGSAFKIAAPRVVSCTPLIGWKHAEASVLSYQKVARDELQLCSQPGDQVGWNDMITDELNSLHEQGHEFWDIEVELLTGRTHQLRAQFAALGLPLICDSLYQPLSGSTVDQINQTRMDNELDFCKVVVCNDPIDRKTLTAEENNILDNMLKTRVVQCPLGLRSHQILLPDGNNIICAKEPWWRYRTEKKETDTE